MQTSGLPTGGGLFKPTGIMSGAGSSLEGEAGEKAKLKKEIRWPIPASELPQRSMSLRPAARMLIALEGITAEPFGSFAIEAENADREPYLVYHLPDGNDVFEVRMRGLFVLDLVRPDGTSALYSMLTQAPPLQSN